MQDANKLSINVYNAFWAYPQNILIGMLADSRPICVIILEARKMPKTNQTPLTNLHSCGRMHWKKEEIALPQVAHLIINEDLEEIVPGRRYVNCKLF